MNRTLLIVASVSSVSSLLLVDSAVKGTALLVLAAVAALMLRRDSAATRHLVWLLALVTLLVVPVLSAMLPQWRVLPKWAGISPEPPVVQTRPAALAGPAERAVELSPDADPVHVERPPATADQPAAELPDSQPALVTSEATPQSAVGNRNWIEALPIVWAIGFSVLLLRLMAARWMLWKTERRGTVIGSSRQPAQVTHDPLLTALDAVCLQLGIGRPVTLVIHPDRTIPVVWGVLRHRLLLPVAALDWGAEQLRSVLLHELAHIQRRDTLGQLLAQIACALHWFNPLVWFAARRLSVERERACDDLVLASGVRPSAYAGHLLEIVTGLSPARWTQACGIAMARQSSIKGRLVAVLSENLNRRGVSVALAAIALAVAVGIAVPVAMLRAADEKPGAPVPQPESRQPAASGGPSRAQPESRKPQDGAKLDPGAEQRLQWGPPVNGLRAAVVIRHSTEKPKAGEMPDLYVVVQNISDAPIRLNDTLAEQQPRMLYIKIDGKTQAGIGAKDPRLGEVTLQSREVAFVPMYSREPLTDGRTTGSIIAEDALKDKRQTFVAKVQIEKAPAGAWTGNLVTGETSAAEAAGQPQPKGKEAQSLFKVWQDGTRTNGKIPGGALLPLARTAARFIKLNPTDERAPKLAELLKRIDTSHDWTPAEAVALLDDVTAVYASLPEWAVDEPRFTLGGAVQTGQPLPAELANAPWGQTQPNGLRMAWLLDPRAEQHRLGTPLKSRILFHNAGQSLVVFRALTWNQSGVHKARNAQGAEINISSVEWTTIPRVVACRLAPGEFLEVIGAGIGVGANKDDEDWYGTRVGAWIEAQPGDAVTFTPAPVSLTGNFTDERAKGDPGWWLEFIKDRLSRDLPLPADAAERRHLLDRAVRDLFGTAPTPEETAAFVADRSPEAFEAAVKRLAQRAGTSSFTGTLQSGETKFRVLPADPDAAKKPRTATGPGRYTLGDNVRLVIVQKPDGERRVNEANLVFFSPAPQAEPAKPYAINLPDGHLTWAIAWERGTTVLWLTEKDAFHRYDFTSPAQVKTATFEKPANADKVPPPILDALRAALDVPGAPKQPPPASAVPAAAVPPTR